MNRSIHIEYEDQVKSDVRYAFVQTYQDYLDTLVWESDIKYLRNIRLARDVAAFGHRSFGETIRPKEYMERQQKAFRSVNPIPAIPDMLSIQAAMPYRDSVLEALMARERANRLGLLSTLIFVKVRSKQGNIINGFIDYFQRLTMTDMSEIFNGIKLLTPSYKDLWYYVHPTSKYRKNDSVLYKTIVSLENGVTFLYKEDNLIIDTNSKNPGINTTKSVIKNKHFLQIEIYDHVPRRKTYC